jgi:hypothetical protein
MARLKSGFHRVSADLARLEGVGLAGPRALSGTITRVTDEKTERLTPGIEPDLDPEWVRRARSGSLPGKPIKY